LFFAKQSYASLKIKLEIQLTSLGLIKFLILTAALDAIFNFSLLSYLKFYATSVFSVVPSSNELNMVLNKAKF
jgi:hypothetical protein